MLIFICTFTHFCGYTPKVRSFLTNVLVRQWHINFITKDDPINLVVTGRPQTGKIKKVQFSDVSTIFIGSPKHSFEIRLFQIFEQYYLFILSFFYVANLKLMGTSENVQFQLEFWHMYILNRQYTISFKMLSLAF